MILGCIADDLTGATDLALMLSQEGLRTIQTIGSPPRDLDLEAVDAVVVALKSRTIPPEAAVAVSLFALRALLDLGARHFFFKYCSTFDSTDRGNIGPVAEALANDLGVGATIACPAFPKAGRVVRDGNLFVNGMPINESPMKDHPLTPMRDANLVRVLQKQTGRLVTAIGIDVIEGGPSVIREAFNKSLGGGRSIAVLDAVTDDHLRSIGTAFADLPLITGGSGLGMGLPAAYLRRGMVARLTTASRHLSAPRGRQVVLAGSCSAATQQQVAHAIADGMPHHRVDPIAISEKRQTAKTVLAWLQAIDPCKTALIYSTDEPEAVQRIQDAIGREPAGRLVEDLLAAVAAELPQLGVTRLIVAGGETAGAVVEGLGVKALAIGPEIDPGVPWTLSLVGPLMALALKSGNFGTPDFFSKAWDQLS